MKKQLYGIIASMLCIFLLSACSTFEKDVTIVFQSGEEIVQTLHTSIFRNAITPAVAQEEIPDGKTFLGWGYTPDATQPAYSLGGLVRYAEIQDYIHDDLLVLYALYGEQPEVAVHDLVIGWYAKTATSGLSQTNVDAYISAFEAFLGTNGYDVATMDIVYRAYDGDVATIGAAINADGDVDFLLGIGNNITSTGNVAVLDKVGEIPMGGKDRFIATLTESELARLAFDFSKTPEAKTALE